MEDTIKLTFEQWHRLGFLVIKGSKGTKTYPYGSKEHYYTFTENQVIKKEQLEVYWEEMLDRASGCPDF